MNFTGVRYSSVTLSLETVSLGTADATGSLSDNSLSNTTAYGNQTSSRWKTTTGTDKVKNTFGDPYTGNF